MPNLKPLQIKQPTDNSTINLALDTINLKKQALVFVNTKRGAERAAEDIAGKIKISDYDPEERKRKQKLDKIAEYYYTL